MKGIKTGFGLHLYNLLKSKKITQKELAERIGVTEATISRYINSNSIPKERILSSIATEIGVTEEELLNYEHPSSFGQTDGYVNERQLSYNHQMMINFVQQYINMMTIEQRKELANLILFGK